MASSTAGDWWVSYFSRLYGTLYRGPLAGDLATADEVAMLARVFAGAGAVLDLGCGHGRHLKPLRDAHKLPVFGLDYSAELLGFIAGKAARCLTRGDLRALPVRDAALGGAFMLFNTFGYFEDSENEAVLRDVARALRPGAAMVMDAPVRVAMRDIVEAQPASVRLQEKTTIQEAWSWNEATNRLSAEGVWLHGKEEQTWSLSLRLYTPTELTRMLRRAGFSGAIEVRPMEDLELIGTDAPVPSATASVWRRAPNMVVRAER